MSQVAGALHSPEKVTVQGRTRNGPVSLHMFPALCRNS